MIEGWDNRISMAIHDEPAALSVEAIEEYLVAAEMCLQHRKADGGCLGYPATLLLFCIVDALGAYLAQDKSSKISKGEPFRVLNHSCFGCGLSVDQIKRLEWWYRNGLAHNAALPPGTCLSGEHGPPFDFAANGDPVKIRVFPFYELVKKAWQGFDKNLIAPSKAFHPRKLPTSGFVAVTEYIGSAVAPSGCVLPPAKPKGK